jgi:hypothetical protein
MTKARALSALAMTSLSLAACGVSAPVSDETRLPRSASRIQFTQQLVLTRAGAKPRVLNPEHDYVATGDTIYASLTPEEDVFVYLGYCEEAEFKLYPEDRVFRAGARRRFEVPVPYDVGDDRVLYVIVGRTEVSLSSPDLAIAIARSRQAAGRQAMADDCAGRAHDDPDSPSSSVIRINARSAEPTIKAIRYSLLRQPSSR